MKPPLIPQPEAASPGIDPEAARLQELEDTVAMMEAMVEWHGQPVQRLDMPDARVEIVAFTRDFRVSSLWRTTAADGSKTYSLVAEQTEEGQPVSVLWAFDPAAKTATKHIHRRDGSSSQGELTSVGIDNVQRKLYTDYTNRREANGLHLTRKGKAAKYAFAALKVARVLTGPRPRRSQTKNPA